MPAPNTVIVAGPRAPTPIRYSEAGAQTAISTTPMTCTARASVGASG